CSTSAPRTWSISVSRNCASAAMARCLFGIGFIVLGILSDGSYALLASMLSGRLRRTAATRRRLDRASGIIYLLLAAVAVVLGTTNRPD
ncbi:MAG: hypothetical protein ACRDSN_21675, partial [Pseudonocardiaceae bacterium]